MDPVVEATNIRGEDSTEDWEPYINHFLDTFDDAENIAFITHDNPDPDAASAAFTAGKLAEARGVDADLFYGEAISHAPNQDFTEALGIPLQQYTADTDLSQYDEVILLDTHGGYLDYIETIDTNQGTPGFAEYVTGYIDHHTENGHPSRDFNLATEAAWKSEDAGSTATLLTALLAEDQFFTRDNVEDTDKKRVAAGLRRGIDTDTYEKEDATTADEHADTYLAHHLDQRSSLGRIWDSAAETAKQEFTAAIPDTLRGFLNNENSEDDPPLYMQLDGPELYDALKQRDEHWRETVRNNYKHKTEGSLEPGHPIRERYGIEYVSIITLGDVGKAEKDHVWGAANREIITMDDAQNGLVLAWAKTENGNGPGAKVSVRAKSKETGSPGEQPLNGGFDIEKLLREDTLFADALDANNMGGKQIRRIHEAGGWLKHGVVQEDDAVDLLQNRFTAWLKDA